MREVESCDAGARATVREGKQTKKKARASLFVISIVINFANSSNSCPPLHAYDFHNPFSFTGCLVKSAKETLKSATPKSLDS